MARLYDEYIKKIKPNLMKELDLKNIFSVPELKKIVINMGLGIDASDKKKLVAAIEDLKKISGPRTKDFSGLSEKNFDGLGNYTFGIKEHIIFPEIDYDKIDKIKGMDITIVTSAKENKEAKSLLKAFNFPLNK